jgi:hypothetical protein
VAKKKAEPKPAAPLSRVRFIKAPAAEKAPEPPEPKWDQRVLAPWAKAMAKLVPSESNEARRERARRELTLLIAKPLIAKPREPLPSTREQQRRRRTRRLLSDDQIDQGKAHYNKKLDENVTPQHWRQQSSAAQEIAALLKLPQNSWQTVEDQIVVPVLIARGLKQGATGKK